VNTDIILGLPGEGLADVRQTLEDVCAFDPENVTVHTLAIKNAAGLTLDDLEGFADAGAVSVWWIIRGNFWRQGLHPLLHVRQKYMTAIWKTWGTQNREDLRV